MNGPNIPIATHMSLSLGSQVVAYAVGVMDTYIHLLGSFWFLGVIMLGFGVTLALMLWSRVKGI